MNFNSTTLFVGRDGCEGPQDHDRTEHICGRPLGLRFKTSTGDLYVADAYMGLLVVGGAGGGVATKLATQAQGLPLGFTNSLDIDQRSGVIYFTDSSTQYPRRYVLLKYFSRIKLINFMHANYVSLKY
jgi:sugar lactone lactonase YvrE